MVKSVSLKSQTTPEGTVRSLVQDLIDDGVYKPKSSIMTVDLKPRIQD